MRCNRVVNQTWMVFLTILLLSSSVFAETWRTITSGWRPSRIVATQNSVWAASEGGVLKVTPGNANLRLLNVDDGLSNNFASTVAVDPATNQLWIGYQNAEIDIYDTSTNEVVQRIKDFFNDPEVLTVHDISFHGNEAFVATNQGLSRLIYSEDFQTWVVVDTYRAFGAWPRSTEILVSAVYDGIIFAGGNDGIAYASLSDNLVNASNWTVIDFVADLGIPAGTNTYSRMLKEIDGELFAIAYFQAILRWETDHFERFTNENRAFGMTKAAGSLYIGTGSGLKVYNETTGNMDQVDPIFHPKIFDVCTFDNQPWTAMDSNLSYFGGIAGFTGDDIDLYYPNTPGGDQVTQIATADDGTLWLTARNSIIAGVFHLVEGIWHPYSNANHPEAPFNASTGITSLEFDHRGDAWVGTWGAGCFYVTQTSVGEDTVLLFNESNSALQAVLEPPSTYVVVSGFAGDPSGGLWIGNQGAFDGHSIVFIPKSWFDTPIEFRDSDSWVRYGWQQGLESAAEAGPMVVDSRGRLWVESLHTGSTDLLTVLDPLGDPEDNGHQEITVIDFNLGMDDYGSVSSMELDSNGILWMGTPAGLFWLDTDLSDLSQVEYNRVFGIIGESVNAVTVDPIGQIWVGTEFGVSVIGRDKYSIVREYTTEEGRSPSPLNDNRVTTIAIDPANGDAYIGSPTGISVVTTPFRNFQEELGTIEVVPQPFLVGQQSNRNLTFSSESLVAGAKVRIYTPSGRLVRSLTFETAAIDGWDGRTESGDFAASGVYMLVVTDSGGTSKVGKVAVVRQ